MYFYKNILFFYKNIDKKKSKIFGLFLKFKRYTAFNFHHFTNIIIFHVFLYHCIFKNKKISINKG